MRILFQTLRWHNLGLNKSLQHVYALHDDESLQHLHFILQRLNAEAVELRKGGREEIPQDQPFLRGTILQPTLTTHTHTIVT